MTVYIPLFALYLLVYLFKKQELLGFQLVHWVFIAIALSLLVSPKRKESYPCGNKKLPWPLWLIGTTGFVSLLYSFFYFGHRFLSEVLTINKPIDLPTIPPLASGGLFPWALVALFAIILQRVYFTNKNTGLISDCLEPIFDISQHSNVGKYCNTYLRLTIFFAMLLPLFFIGSIILFFFTQYRGLTLSPGINMQNIFASTILFYVINFSQWQLSFNWLMKKKFPTLLSMLIVLFSAMILLVLLVSGAQLLPLSYVINYYPFDPTVWNTVLDMLDIFIALSWLPIASSTIAVLSRGYRNDQIIIATLFVPLLTQFYTISDLIFNNTQIAIILLWCSILLLMIFLKDSLVTLVSRGVFPTSFSMRQRKPTLYLRSLLITTIAFIGIFWVTGIYLISLLVSAFTITTALLIMSLVIHYPRFCSAED